MSDSILIRQASKRDIPFITNSWMTSYQRSPAVVGVPDKVYVYHHHKILESVIPACDEAGGLWLVCSEQDHDLVLGWICAFPYREALVIHYTYVKQVYRENGIAKRLFRHLRARFPDQPVVYTHKSHIFWGKRKKGESFHKKVRKMGMMYHPYLLWSHSNTERM